MLLPVEVVAHVWIYVSCSAFVMDDHCICSIEGCFLLILKDRKQNVPAVQTICPKCCITPLLLCPNCPSWFLKLPRFSFECVHVATSTPGSTDSFSASFIRSVISRHLLLASSLPRGICDGSTTPSPSQLTLDNRSPCRQNTLR